MLLESQLLFWLSFTIVTKNREQISNKNIKNDRKAPRTADRFFFVLAVVSPHL